MIYGIRIKKNDYLPREHFAEQVAAMVKHTILYMSKADDFRISLVELEDGEPLAD